MTREKQIEYFKGCLMATGREGVEDLLDFIEELGFYDAPASGGNHCCKDGGLLEHTVNVMQYAEKIGLTLLGSEAYNKIHSSVIIASALHDLGKVFYQFDTPIGAVVVVVTLKLQLVTVKGYG